jgi:hypothetical protein
MQDLPWVCTLCEEIVRKWTQPQLALGKRINGKQPLTNSFIVGIWFHPLQHALQNASTKSPSKAIENPRKSVPFASHNNFE